MAEECQLHYAELPHFVTSTVDGHTGELALGRIGRVPAMVMKGRLHFYEGYTMEEITYPVRLMKFLGAEYIIITAAAGALNRQYRCGDIVFIKDHVNFMGADPLRRQHYEEFGERFPDMCEVYRKDLRKKALLLAARNRLRAHEGVYFGVRGPSYETPAEVRAFRKLGGDIVGMSVVPEAIVANQMGLGIVGIAHVANLASGLSSRRLCHRDVIEAGGAINGKLSGLMKDIIKTIG
jgi:purine-nucleoside phosphorylase